MTKKSSASKTVSHADKLQNLRVEFGRAQERARAKGSVNECSINKICKHADVPKNYLLGHRLQDGDANKTEYLKLADEINEFRETFQPSTETTAERQELIDLTKKYENLANSINPLTKKLLELEESERAVSKIHRSSVDTATMYVAKIKQLEEVTREQIATAFERDDLIIYTNPQEFKDFLFQKNIENTALLLMSSGNYGGLDFEELKKMV